MRRWIVYKAEKKKGKKKKKKKEERRDIAQKASPSLSKHPDISES